MPPRPYRAKTKCVAKKEHKVQAWQDRLTAWFTVKPPLLPREKAKQCAVKHLLNIYAQATDQCCPQPWSGKFLSAVVSRKDGDLELVKVLRISNKDSALNGTSILIPLPKGNLSRGGGENVETRGWSGVL